METLVFDYRDGKPVPASNRPPALVGVVGSGNLEVLVEAHDLSGAARVEVVTAATGFRPIWQAVLDDFFNRHAPSNILISINDVGATPAVVSLRLDQAMEAFKAGGAA
ncbi:malonate decarboxylase acyl carrier protein [Niveispirillum irakense]|uniref:malonate decarboxylase acyl carrier protein n=1 Tax=Niveispirillum irakense TaxID=34011 RepID=UPI0003FC0AE5|nr:malonate decarboxylase acyl carrier protein [Niveispirillum irakense]